MTCQLSFTVTASVGVSISLKECLIFTTNLHIFMVFFSYRYVDLFEDCSWKCYTSKSKGKLSSFGNILLVWHFNLLKLYKEDSYFSQVKHLWALNTLTLSLFCLESWLNHSLKCDVPIVPLRCLFLPRFQIEMLHSGTQGDNYTSVHQQDLSCAKY